MAMGPQLKYQGLYAKGCLLCGFVHDGAALRNLCCVLCHRYPVSNKDNRLRQAVSSLILIIVINIISIKIGHLEQTRVGF